MATRRVTRRTMPRRKRIWARQLGSLALPQSTGGRAQASLDTQFATEYGTTRLPVGTTIGGILIHYISTQPAARGAANDHFTVGVGVFDETTATETPAPEADPHADWMWRLVIPASATSGYTLSSTESIAGPVRVKAQRKISELGERPWLVAENFGAVAYDFWYDVSLLLLLP